MRNSLQDQLLKSGLVTEEQLEDTRAPRRKSRRRARKNRSQTKPAPVESKSVEREPARPVAKLRSDQQRSAQILRDSKLSGQTPEQRAKKQRQRDALRLIEQHKLNDEKADVAHHFVRGRRVKRIYLTPEQRDQLMHGELAIAGIEGNHYLLPSPMVDRLVELVPETFIQRGVPAPATDTDSGDDYADFPVPDDLQW